MKIKKEKIEELKKRMEKERKSIEEMINEFAKESKTVPGDWNTKFPDFKAEGTLDEEADEVEEYSSLLPIERTLEIKIQNINSALKKIEKNEYGKCEICKNNITEERLSLIPETKTCNKCKK